VITCNLLASRLPKDPRIGITFSDTKILETLVQLDNGVDLPIALRVNAFIVSNNE
jgi:hypothetical protein